MDGDRSGGSVASAAMTDIRTLPVTAELIDYVVDHGSWPVDDVLADLRTETLALGGAAGMQIGPDQGQLLTLLTRLVGRPPRRRGRHVHRLLVAVHRPGPGRRRPPAVLRRQRGVDRASPAGPGRAPASPTASTCASRRRSTRCGRCPTDVPIDLAFIDADKPGYVAYWRGAGAPRAAGRRAAGRQRAVGRGASSTPTTTDENTGALRAFNDHGRRPTSGSSGHAARRPTA